MAAPLQGGQNAENVVEARSIQGTLSVADSLVRCFSDCLLLDSQLVAGLAAAYSPL